MSTESRAEVAQSNPPLSQLQTEWLAAKHAEDAYKTERGRIAQLIAAHPETVASLAAKPFGSRQLGTLDLKRDEDREWDQAKLIELAEALPPEHFPFKVEFKEDRKASTALALSAPEVWKKFLPALSLKPGSISLSARK